MPRSLTGEGDGPTLHDVLSEATIAVTAHLGAVAISGSTTVLASIDRATLNEAATTVYDGPPLE